MIFVFIFIFIFMAHLDKRTIYLSLVYIVWYKNFFKTSFFFQIKYPERILSFPGYDFCVYIFIFLWPTWTNEQFIYHWYISSGTKASSKHRFFSNFLTISETVIDQRNRIEVQIDLRFK